MNRIDTLLRLHLKHLAERPEPPDRVRQSLLRAAAWSCACEWLNSGERLLASSRQGDLAETTILADPWLLQDRIPESLDCRIGARDGALRLSRLSWAGLYVRIAW
jgi:hypothetical protein